MQDMVVVITGASAGIGASGAETAAAQGALVVLVARRDEALRAAAARCGARAHAIVADVTHREEVRRVVRESIGRFGRIDVWINNAGQGISRQPLELTDDDIDDMMRINVKSVLYGMQEVMPHFKSRGVGLRHRHPHRCWDDSVCKSIRSAYILARSTFSNASDGDREGGSAAKRISGDPYYSLASPGVVRTEFGVNAIHGGHDSRQFPDSQSAQEVAADRRRHRPLGFRTCIHDRGRMIASPATTNPSGRTRSPYLARRWRN